MKESKIELTHYFHPHDNFYTLRSVHKKCIHQIDFWVEPRFYQPRIHGALNLALHHCVSKRVTTGGYPYLWVFKGVGADPCVCPETIKIVYTSPPFRSCCLNLVLARSPDLARVLTIRSPSVQSVVLAVVLLDLASTGIS